MILWFVGMRYRERHGEIPLLEPFIQQWTPRKPKSVDIELSTGVPNTPLESDDGKVLGSRANYRINEISAA